MGSRSLQVHLKSFLIGFVTSFVCLCVCVRVCACVCVKEREREREREREIEEKHHI